MRVEVALNVVGEELAEVGFVGGGGGTRGLYELED